jgi:hypothetical protein
MSPIDVLTDLFGNDPTDLHGTVVFNAAGLAQLVIDALATAGYQIVQADH